VFEAGNTAGQLIERLHHLKASEPGTGGSGGGGKFDGNRTEFGNAQALRRALIKRRPEGDPNPPLKTQGSKRPSSIWGEGPLLL